MKLENFDVGDTVIIMNGYKTISCLVVLAMTFQCKEDGVLITDYVIRPNTSDNYLDNLEYTSYNLASVRTILTERIFNFNIEHNATE